MKDVGCLGGAFEEVGEKIVINTSLDIVNINLTNIDSKDVKKFDFVDMSMTYLFYY